MELVADERTLGRLIAYGQPMSRWDVAPTARQRWIARNSARLRVGLLLWIALVVAFGAYVLITEGFNSTVVVALTSVAGPLSAFVVASSTARYVGNWDREHVSHGRS